MAFAAIGTDGIKEVVWGIGPTAAAAERTARAEAAESDCDPGLTRTVEIPSEVEQRVYRGDVDVRALGI